MKEITDPNTGEVRKLKSLTRAILDENGHEVVSDLAKAPPIGYKREKTMVDRIREMVRVEASRHAQMQGMESFEEADDFDIDEDDMPGSPFEMVHEPLVPAPASPAVAAVEKKLEPPSDGPGAASQEPLQTAAPSKAAPPSPPPNK